MYYQSCMVLLVGLTVFTCSIVCELCAHRPRHSPAGSCGCKEFRKWDEHGITPCDLPDIRNQCFETVCAEQFKKPYICTPDDLFVPGFTAVEYLEKGILAGNFLVCKYDTLKNEDIQEMLGDNFIESVYFDMLKKAEEEEMNQPGQPRKREKGIEPPLVRDSDRRPRISIMFLDRYASHESFQSPETFTKYLSNKCPPKASSLNETVVQSQSQLSQFYANMSRLKWRTSTCETDLAILVLGSSMFYYKNSNHNQRSATFAVSISDQWIEYLTVEGYRNVTNIIKEINQDTNNISDRLIKFLQSFVYIMDEYYPPRHSNPKHTVPRWALALFAGCTVVSLLAAVLGNWVSADHKGKSSSLGAGKKPGRKWGAGFSGGMWAS